MCVSLRCALRCLEEAGRVGRGLRGGGVEHGDNGRPDAVLNCPRCSRSLSGDDVADGLCVHCGCALAPALVAAVEEGVLSERERTSAEREQTIADSDQTLSDRDQGLSDHDQHASDEDQRSADADAQAGDDPAVRARTRAARERSSAERTRSSHERDESAQMRLDQAEARDREAERRDQAAAARDRLAAHIDASEGLGAELADAHSRAARARERAAAARERARADRELAAADRAAAAHDRDVLRASLDLAALDELTAAWTRRAGLEMLDRELVRAERSGGWLTLAFLDVDGLKRVNDDRGHAAGDELLRTLAKTVAAHVRAYDLLIRYGGDEFLCVASGWPPTRAGTSRRR